MAVHFVLPEPIIRASQRKDAIVLEEADITCPERFRAKCRGTHFLRVLPAAMSKCEFRLRQYLTSHILAVDLCDSQLQDHIVSLGIAIALCYTAHRTGDVRLINSDERTSCNLVSTLMSDGLNAICGVVGDDLATTIYTLLVNEADIAILSYFHIAHQRPSHSR